MFEPAASEPMPVGLDSLLEAVEGAYERGELFSPDPYTSGPAYPSRSRRR